MCEDRTIFVVDDNADLRASIRALVESMGYGCRSFPSAEEFLANYSAAVRGVVVIDLRMPGMNGLELQQELLRRKSRMPVIIVTAYARTSAIVQAIHAGAVTAIDKPYHDDDLWDAIQHNRKYQKQKAYRLDFTHRLQLLDARERLTLEMIVAGHGNRAVESRLGLSTRTVDRIRCSILEKMNFLSFVELSAAYGAARMDDRRILTLPTTGASDTSVEDDSGEEAVECLCAGLLRIQSILLTDEEINDDCRPILRDAEVALSKALGKIGGSKPPAAVPSARSKGA